MNTLEILDDEESYGLSDVEPEYNLLAIREQARREGREYRGLLSGHLGDNNDGQDESVTEAIARTSVSRKRAGRRAVDRGAKANGG